MLTLTTELLLKEGARFRSHPMMPRHDFLRKEATVKRGNESWIEIPKQKGETQYNRAVVQSSRVWCTKHTRHRYSTKCGASVASHKSKNPTTRISPQPTAYNNTKQHGHTINTKWVKTHEDRVNKGGGMERTGSRMREEFLFPTLPSFSSSSYNHSFPPPVPSTLLPFPSDSIHTNTQDKHGGLTCYIPSSS